MPVCDSGRRSASIGLSLSWSGDPPDPTRSSYGRGCTDRSSAQPLGIMPAGQLP
jgi:hypothetical protein